MPTSKKTSTFTKTASKSKKKSSWLSSLLARRYAKPVVTVLAFVLVGGATMVWAMAATTTSSLWGNTVPAVLSSSDTSSTELGLRFKSNVAGYVTGVRFYKSAQNTGVHTGSLWDNSGNLLATVSFTNESASGWQSVNFDKPVNIASNVTYVVAYHAPNGHYSYNSKYLSRSAYVNGHLTALRNTSAHANGVYTKSAKTFTYPTTGGNGTNYWVDVLFSTSLINSQVGPAAPTGVSATAWNSTSVAVTWQASVSDSPITNYIVYRDGNKLTGVGTATGYSDLTAVAGTTYKYQVQAVDSNGVSSALSTAVTVTTPSGTNPGGSTSGGANDTGKPDNGAGEDIATTCPFPAFPDANCTGVPAAKVASLTPVSGDLNVTNDNAVVDGADVRNGCINIEAVGVTVKNSRARCVTTAYNTRARDPANPRLTVQDTEISCGGFFKGDPQGPGLPTPYAPAGGLSGIGDRNINAYRVDIHDCENGFDADSDITIKHSYIHDLYTAPDGPNSPHTDGLQSGVGSNLKLEHNTFYGFDAGCRPPNDGSCNGTSAINIFNANSGPAVHDTQVSYNLIAGGAYALYCPKVTTTNFNVSNNHFSTVYSPMVGEYGPSSDCSNETLSGNLYQETGNPVTLD